MKEDIIFNLSVTCIYFIFIILPVVLYGWGTWFLTLREEHRLRVFVNRVLDQRGRK
jgi:hypothetical protein